MHHLRVEFPASSSGRGPQLGSFQAGAINYFHLKKFFSFVPSTTTHKHQDDGVSWKTSDSDSDSDDHHHFLPRTTVDWNQLEISVVHANSVKSFKPGLLKPGNCVLCRLCSAAITPDNWMWHCATRQTATQTEPLWHYGRPPQMADHFPYS